MKALFTYAAVAVLAASSFAQAISPTTKRILIPKPTPTQNPPPQQQGAPPVVIGKAQMLTVTNTWPDYPAVALLGVTFGSQPNYFPGLGPNKCWIPVTNFAIERDPAQVKPHFFFKFRVKQGIWTDALTAQQGSNWPVRAQFHTTTKGGDTYVLAAGTCPSVKWVYESGNDPGLYADVAIECDNYLIHAP